MNIKETKKIQIADYLQSLGYTPAKRQGVNLWYKSPFRDEKEASFKIDTKRNLWYDFGSAQGGNIIDLAARLYASNDVSYLLKQIAEQTPHIRPASFSFHQQSSLPDTRQEIKVKPLTHPALIKYLRERRIDIEQAKRVCKQLHIYTNNKWYFSIGFLNASGGYEVRNKYFKGCIPPKDITCIQQGSSKSCLLFEGFIDYLSLLTLYEKNDAIYSGFKNSDVIILNSVSNLTKVTGKLEKYEYIHCFLDNDTAGGKVVQEIRKQYGFRVFDASSNYCNHKDLNDYLCRHSLM